jgi:hypothetical protein
MAEQEQHLDGEQKKKKIIFIRLISMFVVDFLSNS